MCRGAESRDVGSTAKREYLQSLGIKHIFNSRSLEFADDRGSTRARLNLVLNSFPGDFIPKNLSILAKVRFLEIGKVGVWSTEQVRSIGPMSDIGSWLWTACALKSRSMSA